MYTKFVKSAAALALVFGLAGTFAMVAAVDMPAFAGQKGKGTGQNPPMTDGPGTNPYWPYNAPWCQQGSPCYSPDRDPNLVWIQIQLKQPGAGVE